MKTISKVRFEFTFAPPAPAKPVQRMLDVIERAFRRAGRGFQIKRVRVVA